MKRRRFYPNRSSHIEKNRSKIRDPAAQKVEWVCSLNLSIINVAEISHSTTVTRVVELSYCSLRLNQLKYRGFPVMILVSMMKGALN